MLKPRVILIFFFLFGILNCSLILGQSPLSNGLKSRSLFLLKEQKSYALDTPIIAHSSLTFSIDSIQISDVKFELNEGRITFHQAFLDKNDQKVLDVSFRQILYNLFQPYRHLDPSLLTKQDAVIYIGYDNSPSTAKNNALITESGIDYDGSFARGFSVGNGQNLLLNSNFNMQLAGDLGDGIKVKAAISDDNIPIQPEGNTQLLQEFDRVFIEVSKDKTSIIAGDYDLKRPSSYFLNYSKQLKGMSVLNSFNTTENSTLTTRGSFAVSRAQFNRFSIPVIEGNQGPYKLLGGNGERFIIVESGSEKVFEDGRLLTRGQDHDYIISYDQAEIIFTDKKLITKDSRIIVEYEYVDRSYLRSLYAIESNYKNDKLEFNFNFYNLQDSKTVTGDTPLDSVDLAILGASGDDPTFARRSGIREYMGELNNAVILYALTQPDSILRYSTHPDSALYSAAFSEVVEGTGSYIIDNEANANGRVYKYVGEGNGSYIPEIQLIAPKKSQIMALGTTYRPTKNTKISGELSLSNTDLNRLSDLDKENDIGLASYLSLSHDISLGDSIPFIITPFIDVEVTQAAFQSLNPYRATEFTRDWNLNLPVAADEYILRSGFNIVKSRNLGIEYTFSKFNQKDNYDGEKHASKINLTGKGWLLQSNISYLSSTDLLDKTQFLRPRIDISKNLPSGWRLIAGYDGEFNRKKLVIDDSFNPASQAFQIYKSGISRSIGNKGIALNLGYKYRIDQLIVDRNFTDYSRATDFSIGGKWKHGKSGNLDVNLVQRDLKVTNSSLTTLSPKKSILGQIEYKNKLWNGGISTITSYNIGSGQQAKVEYDYQEVLPGEGNFDWIDFNNDGIQQSGEFRASIFRDTSRYIQVALFNNEFVQTNNTSINQSLRFDPKLFFDRTNKSKDGFWKKSIKRLSTNSNIRIAKKISTDDGNFNPLNFSSQDTSIVNYLASNNHTLFINRGSPFFDWQLGYNANQSNIIQISGYETRENQRWTSTTRLTIKSLIDAILDISLGTKNGDSEVFEERDFAIDFLKVTPQINYRPTNAVRFTLKYGYQDASQKIGNLESAKNHEIDFGTSIRQASKTSWDLGFRFVTVAYDGTSDSFVAFELLEDLKPGKNFIWNSAFTKRLSGSVDLILNYEGRKSGVNKTIHTARAQIKATF